MQMSVKLFILVYQKTLNPTYIKETGSAGRDGIPSLEVIVPTSSANRKADNICSSSCSSLLLFNMPNNPFSQCLEKILHAVKERPVLPMGITSNEEERFSRIILMSLSPHPSTAQDGCCLM